ncbi:hypothetical protein Sgly_2432 [Syntrophobotulus glycolicus DSM 8271]|uniref:Uncharacterized protein n=1 Tax=Syntrophobotulus glycolicus (strain DSM 8271 / FlGlyR) TaxID=645991 RepID=F0SVE4_SYNGF|nr:hypothetical protein [Syntrophobotulus glycolicus]ADY56717.1 hypothetical protein Sgly_2432 [Syntrophobotulus glycolicus DSM 8271]
MNKKRDYKRIMIIILLFIFTITILFIQAPAYAQARSYMIMFLLDKYEGYTSVMAENKIDLNIPDGRSTGQRDWYRLMNIHNDEKGISNFTGRNLSLSVLYTFGGFKWYQSSSDFFIPESPLYNSFYGGYVIKDKDGGRFGFDDAGELVLKDIMAVPEYDYKYLVLKSLDCTEDKMVMKNDKITVTKDIEYIGEENWTKIDTIMVVNSPTHKYRAGKRAYIQYGVPVKREGQKDFGLMTMHGRIYAKYFDEYQATIFLYVMTPEQSTLEKTDRDYLSKTTIAKRT